MTSNEGPTEAIVKLLSDELKSLIRALPDHLKESVPDELKLDTPIANNQNETPPRGE